MHDSCAKRSSRWHYRLPGPTRLATCPQISLMDVDDPPDNSIPNPVDTGPALGDEEVCQGLRARVHERCHFPFKPAVCMKPRKMSLGNSPKLRCLRFQGVTTSGFKEELLPDDGDDEAPQEDHVVQLRCVLEIMNTGARCCSCRYAGHGDGWFDVRVLMASLGPCCETRETIGELDPHEVTAGAVRATATACDHWTAPSLTA